MQDQNFMLGKSAVILELSLRLMYFRPAFSRDVALPVECILQYGRKTFTKHEVLHCGQNLEFRGVVIRKNITGMKLVMFKNK